MEAWHKHTAWLYGSRVWGVATMDLEGNIFSVPKIENVLMSDIAMHKAICGHLNTGIDFVEAIELARDSPHLMSTSLYAHVSIDPGRTTPPQGSDLW